MDSGPVKSNSLKRTQAVFALAKTIDTDKKTVILLEIHPESARIVSSSRTINQQCKETIPITFCVALATGLLRKPRIFRPNTDMHKHASDGAAWRVICMGASRCL
jgi:hypothetical protein